MKAIDVWMGACMAFVFGVMIEFTICHFARNQIEIVPNTTSKHMVANTLTTLFGEKPLSPSETTENEQDNHLLQPPSDSRLRSPEASEPPPSAHFFIGSETAN
uniref:Uncharacterized protein n=1 Tax=Plectus sambesii TaxID=2011161 RepID=A0A914VNE1_9BILA